MTSTQQYIENEEHLNSEAPQENNQQTEMDNSNYGEDFDYYEDRKISVDEDVNTSRIFDIIKDFATLSSILRMTGALIVIAAMSTFMIQDWAVGNDIDRYYLLLGQTLLLAFGGFGLSFLLKENKGARVFFGLGLISITVNLTTLGAIIFSTTQWGSTLVQYPAFAKWQATGIDSIFPALALSGVIMIPIAIFSFMIFARRSAKILSFLFLFTNSLLLIPARESLLIGLVALFGALLPMLILRKITQKDRTLVTAEGYFAMGIIFLPALIIIARNIWLYNTDDLLQMTLAIMVFVALRIYSTPLDIASKARNIMDWTSVAMAGYIAYPLAESLEHVLSGQIYYSVFGIAFAAFTLDVARRSMNKTTFASFAAYALALSHFVQLISVDGLISAVLCIASGIAIIMIGSVLKQKSLFILGAVTVFAGLAQQLYQVIVLVDFSSWVTLTVIGMSTIVIASIIERHGAVIKLKWSKLTTGSLEE